MVSSTWRRIRGVAPASAWSLVPGVRDLRGYRRSQLRPDLLAGLTTAAVAVPAGLAMGALAGLSPVAGLYATMLPVVGYAVFGSSRQLMVGPDGTLALLTAVSVAPLAGGSVTKYAAMAAALALLAGLVHLVGAAIRLGFMADFLSKPILVGYVNGVALTIIVGQVGKVIGVSVTASGFFPTVAALVRDLGQIHWVTAGFSAALLAMVLVLKKLVPSFPGSLLAVVVADVASVAFDLQGHGVSVVGPVPSGLPSLGLPAVSLNELRQLAPAAAGLALVAFADTIAIARTYAEMNGYRIDANRELLALGTANVAAGVSSALAISASGSRTALNDTSGGTSQVVGLIAAVAATIVAAVGTPLLAPLPTAALGVVVIAAVLGMLDYWGVVRLRHVQSSEVAIAGVTLLGVLAFGALGGLLLAVVISIGVFVYRTVRPHDAVLGVIDDVDGYHDIGAYPAAETLPGLIIYRFDAPLYFPNVPYFLEQIRSLVASADPPARWVVLNVEAITYIDATAIDALRRLHAEMAARGITLAVARAKVMLRRVFESSGLTDEIGRDYFFSTLNVAVAAYQRAEGDSRDWTDN